MESWAFQGAVPINNQTHKQERSGKLLSRPSNQIHNCLSKYESNILQMGWIDSHLLVQQKVLGSPMLPCGKRMVNEEGVS